MRYPAPLRPGDLIGVTSPSSGVGAPHRGRLDFAVADLERRGYRVRVGACMGTPSHVSAPAAERAAELMTMLTDPEIRAVVPPWGGETAVDLLPLLDFEALRRAEPTWVVGYSDMSTLLLPITLLAGWATLHGNNLMDTPYEVPAPLVHWLDVAEGRVGDDFSQSTAGVFRTGEWDDWERDPTPRAHRWNGTAAWVRFDAGTAPIDVSGRLIGGCIETIAPFTGSRFADPGVLGDEPRLVYLEAAESDAFTICRLLHGMRLNGFFDGAAAVLIGRTSAPDAETLPQREAVLDALAPLGVPIVGEVDLGHVPPQLTIVNGALGRLRFGDDVAALEQRLV
jgi:muramoyltetrapeptide carboxypeptidase LdcA involved in peptidoglycan recycling